MPRPDRILRYGLIAALLLLILLSSHCTPPSPAKGSPEWLYSAAKEEFKSGGILKAEENLEKLENLQGNPYQARAAAWDLLIKSGRMLGYEELAEAYSDGIPASAARKINFSHEKTAQLTELRGYTLHYLETLGHFEKATTGDTVTLEFPFPDGSGAPVPELERIEKGHWTPDGQRSVLHGKVMQRGMLRGISAALTAIDDVPGAQKAMASGTTTVPRARFLIAAAGATSRGAKFFDTRFIGESDKRKMLLQRTVALSKSVRDLKPDASIEKEARKLQEAAEKDLKKTK